MVILSGYDRTVSGGSRACFQHVNSALVPTASSFVGASSASVGWAFASLQPKGDVKAEDIGRVIVLHELGHLVGLGHVEDPTQVMYPSSSYEVTSLAPGDINGLAKLGRGDCFPTL
jgi:Matrixin